MSKRKKIFLWIMGGVGAFLFLLFIAMLLAPRLINLKPIREKVLATASEKVGGEVRFQKVDLSFFPLPHAVIQQASISIPNEVSGSIDALSVYPKILPLFRGKLYLSEIQVERPDFRVNLPEKPEGSKKGNDPTIDADIERALSRLLAPLALDAPDLVAEVENGTLDISVGSKPLFSFRNINTRLVFPPKGFRIELTSASNLWQSLEVEGTLDSEHLTGEGRISLRNFQPHKLTTYLIPETPQQLVDSQVNLSLGFKFDGLKALNADVEGSFPRLAFKRENRETIIEGKTLKATLNMHEGKIAFSLHELTLGYPQLNVSAKLQLGQGIPKVVAELEARDVDVPTLREVALALAGDISDVQEIFGIIRGGKVPLITVKSEGNTYDQLGDIKNILIKGHIVEGKILVPDVDLDLADVKGEAVISEGVLYGENLEARVGNSWGREGKLKLGLGEDDDTFHLDIGVQADLAELPPIMKRLFDDKSFQEELSLIESLRGNAEGRLILGETTKSINPRVDVSKLALSTKYQRIPFPIVISGGQFSFDDTRIAVKNLNGKLGKSSFSQLAARLALKEKPLLEVTSGKIDAVLDEIHSWITSMEGSPVSPEYGRAMKGTVSLTSVRYKGLLSKPEVFDIETTGQIKDVVVDIAVLPHPVKVPKGSFHTIANPTTQKSTVKHAQVSFMDASLNVSGRIDDYFKGLNKMELTFGGDAGPEFTGWVSNLVQMPPALNLRTPLSVSDGHLVWQKDTKTSFKGDLLVKDGPKVSVDLFQNSQELSMKNTIKDELSDASTALTLRERTVGLEFTGNLKRETLNSLFVKSGFLHGWLEGDFRANISLDHPMQSTAQGHLMGEDLLFPWQLEIPLEVDKISLKAAERHVDVERATLVSGSQKMDLKGSLNFSPPGLVFDMDVKSNGISWAEIEKVLNENVSKNESEEDKASWDLPVKGTVRLKSEYLNYERFTWFPFHADITFAQDEIDVKVIQANLCHVSTPGSLKITPQDISLDFNFVSKDQEVNPTILCVSGKQSDITGHFDLLGMVKAQGKEDKLLESLNGNVEFTARDGRIRRHVPLQRVFAYLNVTKSMRGQLPDMSKEEFVYNSITAKATFQDGKFILKESIVDSPSMEIISEGYVDYITNEMDITVLVAPLKTVDWVVKKIPLVRRVLQGTLVAVPVRVSGDLADPKVSPMSASAVGSSLLGVLKRTAALPFELIDVEPTGGAENIPMERPEP